MNAGEHDIPKAFGSYDELPADSEVHAVSISVPNGLHAEWSQRALRAGTHVLGGSRSVPAAADVVEAFDAARTNGVPAWRRSCTATIGRRRP